MEILWRLKSRIKWLQKGGGNTKFFHASVKNKKKSQIIDRMVLEDCIVLKSADDIHEGAVQFFKDLLLISPISMGVNDLALLTSIITMEENLFLCKPPILEEVKDALWSIPKDSSPGPDGFSASFFITAWDIVKDDLLVVATEFFGGTPLTSALGATNIFLIPKVEAPDSFAKFRPISLCSVVYKVLSKIMVAGMVPLLDKLISHEQYAFIQGRSIFDNIFIAQELVQRLNKKVRGGNVIMKIDMAKAYDRVNWCYLLVIL